jgi:hypothetical protein
VANNVYSLFRSLIPSDPLLLGTVLATDDGKATVELLGGEVVVVRGRADVASKVFVRGGAIENDAPNLPFVSIDV